MKLSHETLSQHHSILNNLLMLALGLICGLVLFLAFSHPVGELQVPKQGPAPVPASQKPQIKVQTSTPNQNPKPQ